MGENESWTRITSNLGGYNHIVQNSQEGQLTKVITLAEYCQASDIKKIDLLKIDVEGFEYFVLKGAEKLLKDKVIKKIIFEVDDHEKRYSIKSEDYSNLLSQFNYKRIPSSGNHQFWIAE